MIRWIVLALAIYLLYRLFANDFLKKRKKDEQEESKNMKKKIEAGEMVKDPECGAYVPVDDSVTVRDGDKVYQALSRHYGKILAKLQQGNSGGVLEWKVNNIKH